MSLRNIAIAFTASLGLFGCGQEVDKTNQVIQNGRILAIGASLTEGHGVDPTMNYPSQLQQKLTQEGFTQYQVFNEGISGNTSQQLLDRVDPLLEEPFEIALLGIGANDSFRGRRVSQTTQNIAQIITKLQDQNTTVILFGIKPGIHRGLKHLDDFEKMYADLAEEFQITLMPNFLTGVALRPSLNNSDGIHPNAAGYTKVVNNLWEYLEPHLRKSN